MLFGRDGEIWLITTRLPDRFSRRLLTTTTDYVLRILSLNYLITFVWTFSHSSDNPQMAHVFWLLIIILLLNLIFSLRTIQAGASHWLEQAGSRPSSGTLILVRCLAYCKRKFFRKQKRTWINKSPSLSKSLCSQGNRESENHAGPYFWTSFCNSYSYREFLWDHSLL